MINKLITVILKTLYRVEIIGIENFHKAGDKVLIVANHLSYLDPAILAYCLPEKAVFAINTQIAEKWYIKPLLHLVETWKIDPDNPFATRELIKQLNLCNKCVVFPEGRISTTGGMMKIYDGASLIADKCNATILPIHIDGVQYSFFSKVGHLLKRRIFPKVILTIHPPCEFKIDDELVGKKRRRQAQLKLYDIMCQLHILPQRTQSSIPHQVIQQLKLSGRNYKVMEDINRKPLSYGSLVTKFFILSNKIIQLNSEGQSIAIMLPNTNAMAITLIATQIAGKTPVMINYTMGSRNICSTLKTSKSSTLITSKKFIDVAKLQNVIENIQQLNCQIIYLEELATTISPKEKIMGLLNSLRPNHHLTKLQQQQNFKLNGERTAVMLFTSGSEGAPKGVLLSHSNVLSNVAQGVARFSFNQKDKFFINLPLFHSFGFTALMLAITKSSKIFLYPKPLDYRAIPELIYDTESTIFFSTNTFLNGYQRYASRYDLHTLRMIMVGAEKLKQGTLKYWREHYSVPVYEGYGVTETSPIISANTPFIAKSGTVGRFMPNMEYYLRPVEGIEEGGSLTVRGPNIMQGYIMPDNPDKLIPPPDGWHDTGDIATVDEEGMIQIKGRVKRFIKIAGEMVSLTQVEELIKVLLPEHQSAAIGVEDSKKGEAIILITTCPDLSKAKIRKHLKNTGSSELLLPKTIKYSPSIPALGSGKTNYPKIQAMEKAQEFSIIR